MRTYEDLTPEERDSFDAHLRSNRKIAVSEQDKQRHIGIVAGILYTFNSERVSPEDHYERAEEIVNALLEDAKITEEHESLWYKLIPKGFVGHIVGSALEDWRNFYEESEWSDVIL